ALCSERVWKIYENNTISRNFPFHYTPCHGEIQAQYAKSAVGNNRKISENFRCYFPLLFLFYGGVFILPYGKIFLRHHKINDIMQIMCCKTNAVPEWAAAGGGFGSCVRGKTSRNPPKTTIV
ncbi:MAG: hypothetical protein ACLUIO_17385, partial [Neglectibacter timonensis]